MLQSHKSTKGKHNKQVSKSTHIAISKKQVITLLVCALLFVNVILFVSFVKIRTLDTQKNTVISINEERIYAGVSVSVSDVKEETGYVMGIKPTESEKIIGLTLSITNNSTTPFEIYPSVQTFIRDNQGVTYGMAPVILEDTFAAKTLQPGESESGRLSYLVTNRAIPLMYYIENRQSNIGPFVVKLQ